MEEQGGQLHIQRTTCVATGRWPMWQSWSQCKIPNVYHRGGRNGINHCFPGCMGHWDSWRPPSLNWWDRGTECQDWRSCHRQAPSDQILHEMSKTSNRTPVSDLSFQIFHTVKGVTKELSQFYNMCDTRIKLISNHMWPIFSAVLICSSIIDVMQIRFGPPRQVLSIHPPPPPSTSSWRTKNTSYERPPVGQFTQTVPGRLVCSEYILLVADT